MHHMSAGHQNANICHVSYKIKVTTKVFALNAFEKGFESYFKSVSVLS